MTIRVRHFLTVQSQARRQLSSSSSSSTSTPKTTPLLYKTPSITDQNDAVLLQLLSWGRGASGQLGGGIEETRLYPAPVANLLLNSVSLSPSPGQLSSHNDQNAPNVLISCGLFHSALIVDGQLWIWGKGDGGRLGLGHEHPHFRPVFNPHLDNPLSSLALGGVHSVALTSQGQVFTWGYGGFGALGHEVYTRELLPRLVQGGWTDKILHISTSGTHTAAIAQSGELYTWGRDQGDGRLGLGPRPGPNEGGGLSIPSKVEALSVPVAAVACGGFFTMALTEDGQLWNWGANSNFELGRGNRVGGWKPQPVPSLKDVCITQIACGGYHSLALTDKGKVLSWGYGGHGQLGHSSLQNQPEPAVVEALSNERIVYVTCGGSSSAAVTDKGKLYMWGYAKDSQLGTPGASEKQTSPVEVRFLMEDDSFGSYNVLSVAIGASHAMCLVERPH